MEEKNMKKKILAVLLATGVAATTLLGGSILVPCLIWKVWM